MSVARPDEPLDDEYRFFCFADSVVKARDTATAWVGLSYYLDLTQTRRCGVYRAVGDSRDPTYSFDTIITPEWYCDSSLEWLEEVVEKKVGCYREAELALGWLSQDRVPY